MCEVRGGDTGGGVMVCRGIQWFGREGGDVVEKDFSTHNAYKK